MFAIDRLSFFPAGDEDSFPAEGTVPRELFYLLLLHGRILVWERFVLILSRYRFLRKLEHQREEKDRDEDAVDAERYE